MKRQELANQEKKKSPRLKILVTAGPTCEDLDPVRFLTNRSSGRMGYALAGEASARGHEVVLVSGPVHLEPPSGVRVARVRTAAEMLEACEAEFAGCQAALLAAAVADYRPVRTSSHKIKKSQNSFMLELTRTEDIARRLGQRKGNRVIVGFALESAASRVNAERKLADKNFDAIVLNGPETFGAGRIRAELLLARDIKRAHGWQTLGTMTKAELASLILDLVESRVPDGRGPGRRP